MASHRRENVARDLTQNGASTRLRYSILQPNVHLAISTLLQPPIVRTGLLPHSSLPPSATHRAPTTRDIPPVTLTSIPHIDNSVFSSYLAQVGPLYDAKSRADGDESSSQWLRRGQPKDDEFPDLVSIQPSSSRPRPSSRQSSTASISLLSPVESPHSRRRSSGGLRNRPLPPTPLSTIPTVYFEENFHLENPRTFDIVSERSEVIPTPQTSSDSSKSANGSANGAPQPPRKALATNAILQEKLSWYLDTVEIHLISSISTASKSFFAALGSLKDLHSEAEESVKEIQRLRADLAQLDKEMAIGGLEIVKLKQRRENLRKLAEAVYQLSYIVDGARHCEELVSNGDLETAIDRIQILEDFTCGHLDAQKAGDISWLCQEAPRQLLDLRQLKALDGFAEGMDQLRFQIGKGYEARFIEALLTDLREHVKNVPNRDTLKRWARKASATQPRYLETNSELRKKLSATLQGLNRAKYTAQAAKTFRDQIMKEVKSLIRQHLPSSSDDDVDSSVSSSTRSSRNPSSRQEKSTILARNLRSLSPADAEELFTKVYCGVGEALRRLQVQVRLLLDISSGQAQISPKSPPRSPMMGRIDATVAKNEPQPELQAELMQTLDMSSLLGQAVDTAQTQITRVLKVRSDEVKDLNPAQFLRYFTLNRLFADECEAVSGRSGTALRGVVDVQIREFITVVSDKERQHLAQTMEEDKWDAWDFTERDAQILNEVLLAMDKDPEPWLRQSYIWEEQTIPNGIASPPPTPALAQTNGTATQKDKEKEKTCPAMVAGEPFNIPKSSILLLHGLSRLTSLLICIPRLSDPLSSSILDYLRLFNSRCNQLVLFAGATRSAGLANINTKHLALASQALGFIVALIPYVREAIRRKVGSMPGMIGKVSAFDGLMRETQRCQIGIHEKLVDIMSARATARVKSMRAIDYDAEGASGPDGPASKFMETLTKETGVLHRVLSRHVGAATVGMIMGPVFENYRVQFGGAFREPQVRTEAGKARYVSSVEERGEGGIVLTRENRLLRDAELFDSKISKIDGAGDLGTYVVNIVKEKAIVQPQPRQSSTTEGSEGTETSSSEARPSAEASGAAT